MPYVQENNRLARTGLYQKMCAAAAAAAAKK
jgi:hypothetical protein